jgi:hypothetical protein
MTVLSKAPGAVLDRRPREDSGGLEDPESSLLWSDQAADATPRPGCGWRGRAHGLPCEDGRRDGRRLAGEPEHEATGWAGPSSAVRKVLVLSALLLPVSTTACVRKRHGVDAVRHTGR